MNSANRKIARKTREQLVQLFPLCFMPRGKPKLPLAHDLIADILARAPQLDRRKVKLALMDYRYGETYLAAQVFGATRVDLDGKERGCVNPAAADRAATALAAIRANNAHQARRVVHTAPNAEQHP